MNTSSAKFSRGRLAAIKSEQNIALGISRTLTGFMINAGASKKTLPKALKLMKEIMFNPALNEKNFDKAKKEVQLAYDAQILRAKYSALEETYGDHPLGLSDRKIKEGINSVTLKDVQKYYNDLMENASADVAVTGHISSVKNLPSIVEEEFKTIGRDFSKRVISVWESIKTLPNTKVVAQTEQGRTQSEIVQFFHVPAENLKDVAAMSVMDTILGGGLSSRMFNDLRETQKLAYGVGSNFVPNDKMSQQVLIIKTSIKNSDGQLNDNIEKSLNGFKEHLDRMMNTYVTEAELVGAKRALNTDNIMSLEMAGGQNTIILVKANTPEGTEYCNKLSKAMNEVTPEDIQRVAKKYLSKPSVISIVTSDEALQKSQKFLGEQGELKIIT
jgi:predicted Zn-dependent peptidase